METTPAHLSHLAAHTLTDPVELGPDPVSGPGRFSVAWWRLSLYCEIAKDLPRQIELLQWHRITDTLNRTTTCHHLQHSVIQASDHS